MILIKIIFVWIRSKDWYRDVLPDVPFTVFRMGNTIFQKAFSASRARQRRGEHGGVRIVVPPLRYFVADKIHISAAWIVLCCLVAAFPSGVSLFKLMNLIVAPVWLI